MQHDNIFPENACNSEQSRVEQSKANKNKALPPLTPPGENDGGATDSTSLEIPGYAYNKCTHNLECLLLKLKQLHINDMEQGEQQRRISHLDTGKGKEKDVKER